ncbi:hypothetical protein POM88_039077 [Heracleum sosnowskyi]|uniref:peptidylprolyl isomerase n=1 Tax=Heracleum sosnowskyi TaxID=360622 RepID=A0AAD8HAS2_9APIA|nr:hypothetical protein POM88_039077 [Heracleum sosnowskyi]
MVDTKLDNQSEDTSHETLGHSNKYDQETNKPVDKYIYLTVKLIGKLQDGTVFLKKGHDGDEEPFEFQTDEEQVIDGLDKAVMAMKKVLEIDSKNVKALYRRAQAYINLVDLDLAEFDIKKALEIDPANRDVKLEYKVLKEKLDKFLISMMLNFSTYRYVFQVNYTRILLYGLVLIINACISYARIGTNPNPDSWQQLVLEIRAVVF